MKCSVCGSEKMFETSILDDQCTEGYVRLKAVPYVCEDCGHIDLYAPDEIIKEHQDVVRFEEEKTKKISELQEKISKTTSQITKLTAIVADENQTVKNVREAQYQLVELQNELTNLQQELRATSRSEWHRGGWSSIVIL